MTTLQIGPHDALFYEYQAPRTETGLTFVFFNALTGDTSTWEAIIGPRVRGAGHGTLAYNLRGQEKSAFSPDLVLDTDLVVADARRLLAEVNPMRPVLVGLSIGGLFAARAWLKGSQSKEAGADQYTTPRRAAPEVDWRRPGTGGRDGGIESFQGPVSSPAHE